MPIIDHDDTLLTLPNIFNSALKKRRQRLRSIGLWHGYNAAYGSRYYLWRLQCLEIAYLEIVRAPSTRVISDILRLANPVLPVLTIDAIEIAAPLARVLILAGIRAIEVTLRNAAALEVIAEMHAAEPDLLIGAGTIIAPSQLADAIAAGAQFAVSPGLSAEIIEVAQQQALPYLPGVTTPSEMMAALRLGCTTLNFFPAENAGGAALLRTIAGPFAQLGFCPTGGINATNAVDYLKLGNVHCVGGSWIIDTDAVARRAWPEVRTMIERQISALKKLDYAAR